MGVKLYVGGHGSSIQGEPNNLLGERCFSAAYSPMRNKRSPLPPNKINILLDSGTFTHAPDERLTFEQALINQLEWEATATFQWNRPMHPSFPDYYLPIDQWEIDPVICEAIASYDLLIDELWVNGKKEKRRWSVESAHAAVDETVRAAAYLASHREYLRPRRLILGCQGVDADQYEYCTKQVLEFAHPDDWIGLGGWCILGRFTSWMPTFYETLHRVIPAIASTGVKHVHIYGVLYLPALGSLLWMCDKHGLICSTDSSAPILSCTKPDPKKAGVRQQYWKDNVQWWKDTLANLRTSRYYKQPPRLHKQLNLFEVA